MKLYFRPLACSMSVRIVAAEAGLELAYEEVGDHAQTPTQAADFRRAGFNGQVPVLVLGDGQSLLEGPAILQYLADLAPDARLMPPPGTFERARVQQWLNFSSAELHKGVFSPLLTPASPPEVRRHALASLETRFDFLDHALHGRGYLVDAFTVADAYLYPILNWCEPAQVDITRWPDIARYRAFLRERPSISAALQLEAELYFQRHPRT
jgi:glutathione S-transferase